jgi:hypothetical protein
MQCILYKIYFWKGFSYVPQIDMHFICTPMWTKFYSCKKWVLHLTPSLMSMTPYPTVHRHFPQASPIPQPRAPTHHLASLIMGDGRNQPANHQRGMGGEESPVFDLGRPILA